MSKKPRKYIIRFSMPHYYLRKISTVIFFDKSGNVIFQDRQSHSKSGEKYGLFGGGIEEDETPLRALKRELLEELDYRPPKIYFWKKYVHKIKNGTYHGRKLLIYLYFAEITKELLRSKVKEGGGFVNKKLTEINSKDFGDSVENLWEELLEMYKNGLVQKILNFER